MSASDLTTPQQVTTFAGDLASNTTQVQALISATSDQILAELGRQSILPTLYNETLDGAGGTSIMLRQYPVLSVSSLVLDGVAISPVTPNAAGVTRGQGWLLEAGDPWPPGRPQRLSLSGWYYCCGSQNVSVAYTAGYQVTGEAAKVPTGGGAVAARQIAGAWGSDSGVTYANGTSLTLVTGAPSLGQYAVAAGSYTFAAADAGASVLISYGYIPQSLALACAQWVAELVSYSSRIGMRTKSLGGQETMSYDTSAIPARVAMMLQPYRRVVPI